MNKIKIYYNYWLIALMGILFMGCEDEYEPPSAEPNHVSVSTSFGSRAPRLQVNGEMTFIDLSRGVVDRTWTFPTGATDIADSENDENSDLDVVRATFTTPGTYEIQLNQVFGGNVFLGAQEQGINTYDTAISVLVVDSTVASFTAARILDGTPLTNSNGAANEVIAGREVSFTSTSTGDVQNVRWLFERKSNNAITELDGMEVVFKFSSVDDFNVSLIASNGFSTDTAAFEDYVTVVPSTDPVLVDKAYRVDNSVAIEFSREVQNPATERSNFDVVIKNSGRVITPDVSAVRLDPDANNIIYLDLGDEMLYLSDTVTVDYDATTGNLISTDFKKVDSFTDQPVDVGRINLLSSEAGSSFDFSLENSAATNWPYLWWGAPWDGYTFEVSSEQAYSGTQSGKITMSPGGGMIIGHRDGDGNDFKFTAKAGVKYDLGAWVYVESVGDKTSIPDLRFYWTPGTNWGIGGTFFNADFPTGKWIYDSIEVEFPEDGEYSFMIRGANQGNAEDMVFYMDEISVLEVQKRP